MFLQKIIHKLLVKWGPKLTPQIIAKQLRQPSGKLGEAISKKMNEGNKELYEFTLNTMDIQDHQSILEIGFGNGMFFEKLFLKAKNIHISGIDFSSDMVKLARKNSDGIIPDEFLDLHLGDCEVLPFEQHSFDKVFCINVIYFWDNPPDYLSEIHRVLKPGGKFYTTIRDEACMKQIEFTKHGFNLFNEKSWTEYLVNNGFTVEKTLQITESPLEVNRVVIHPKSMCFVAQKV